MLRTTYATPCEIQAASKILCLPHGDTYRWQCNHTAGAVLRRKANISLQFYWPHDKCSLFDPYSWIRDVPSFRCCQPQSLTYFYFFFLHQFRQPTWNTWQSVLSYSACLLQVTVMSPLLQMIKKRKKRRSRVKYRIKIYKHKEAVAKYTNIKKLKQNTQT